MNKPWLMVLVLGLGACHAHTAADERRDYCEEAWTSVELFPPGTHPTRPYAVVSAVDAVIYPTPERRARKMQFKACLLHADAVLDQTEPTRTWEERQALGPWGTMTTERIETTNPNLTPGKGYAIRWTDTPGARPTPASVVKGSPSPVPTGTASPTAALH